MVSQVALLIDISINVTLLPLLPEPLPEPLPLPFWPLLLPACSHKSQHCAHGTVVDMDCVSNLEARQKLTLFPLPLPLPLPFPALFPIHSISQFFGMFDVVNQPLPFPLAVLPRAMKRISICVVSTTRVSSPHHLQHCHCLCCLLELLVWFEIAS